MRARIVSCLFVLVALTACAHGTEQAESQGQGQGQSQLEIRIDNNLIPPVSLEIFLVPRSGIERSLGNLIGSGIRRLQYRGLPLQGEYRLVGRAPGDRTIASSIIVLDRVTSVEWDLMRNLIEVTSVDEDR